MAARAMKGSTMVSWSSLVAARAMVPSVLVACLSPWRGTLQSPVVVAGHSMVVASGHWIVALSLVNVTVHPALVRGETPMRLCCRVSNVWAVAASGGRPWSGRVPVWVDCIVCWLATRTVVGWVVACLLCSGVSLVTKCPLHPESSMVKGGEGPSVVFSMVTSLVTFKLLLGLLGVPLTHLLVLRRGPMEMNSLPPWRSRAVALSLWPSFLCLQFLPG